MNGWAHDALAGNVREVTFSAGRLALLATSRCDEVVAEFTERIRAWCRLRGVVPHNALDIAASLALAMSAGGLAVGPQFHAELMQRAQTLDTPDGQLGLTLAAQQVSAYLSDQLPPLGP